MVSFTFRPFVPGERADGSLCKGGWVGLGTVKEMRKYLVHAGSRIPMLISSSLYRLSFPSHQFSTWESISSRRLLHGVSFLHRGYRVATSNHVCCDCIGWHCYWVVSLDPGLWPTVEVMVRTVFDGFVVFVCAWFVYSGWNTLQLMVNDADHESFSHRSELISTLLRVMDPKCLTETIEIQKEW
jgi:hypothetical protein